ncbi:hypothetical protein BGZ63DRAFT_428317 [Mariannaea sp. PMI_226]|nr:hypothetical protein BGZ63DRAFT_428317 [Mariannaea sp. PMI_226]
MSEVSDRNIHSNPHRPRSAEDDGRSKALERLPRLPKTRPRQLTPPGFRQAGSKHGSKTVFQACAYFKIPPEIRRHILCLAFGQRRVHMDLSYDNQDTPPSTNQSAEGRHCGIGSDFSATKRKSIFDDFQGGCWHWWSSVCHRLPPDHESKSMGPMTYQGSNGPWADTCRLGQAEHCDSWPGGIPSKCHIGTMGWLLSCRQNYAEAVDILYSTNTISMTGSEMLTHLPELILPQRLAHITSSRFVILQFLATNFPHLRSLYLSLEDSGLLQCMVKRERTEAIEGILDQSAQWLSNLSECAISLPDKLFESRFETVSIVWDGNTDRCVQSYHQIWRGGHGEMSLIQLPFVDSYPGPPYHLAQSSAQSAGYWILHGSNLLKKPESPTTYSNGCMGDGMNAFIDLDDFEFSEEDAAAFDIWSSNFTFT